MQTEVGKMPKVVQGIVNNISTASTPQLVRVLKNPLVRKLIVHEVNKFLFSLLRESRSDPTLLPSVQDDRVAMALAIVEAINTAFSKNRMSEAYLRGILQIFVKTMFIDRGDAEQKKKFQEAFGKLAPSFLLIAPGKACNLHCPGCYADADNRSNALEWSLVDRIMAEAKALWGERFFVISGGEPFAYRSEGKGLVELSEKHRDCFFMTYTNGTLINEQISKRLSEIGNMLLCISVEGFRERTDERRGAGVFDKVLQTMEMLRRDGVPFGISLTGTRHNVEEILSDEFIKFFRDRGALLAFVFHYMPIGRSFTIDLMPTPEQRAWMWKRSWEIVREQRFFVADFWNHGTCIDGCIAAGGHGQGGYFYIDWNGAITPCAFMPYSPLNIREVYAQGQNLNDVWQHPFFQDLRQWQYDYVRDGRNQMAPCPSRDHHDELERLLMKHEPEPTDANAAEALIDPEYTRGLVEYNRRFEAITNSIWRDYYLHRTAGKDELLAPLPDIPSAKEADTHEDASPVLRDEAVTAD